MRRPVGYGIDFGTTNSSISIGYDNGDVDLVDVGDRATQPTSLRSLTYLDRGGQRAAGDEAVRNFLVTGGSTTKCSGCALVERDIDGQLISDCKSFRRRGGCPDSRLIAGLKSELSNTEFHLTHSWAVDFSIEDLVGVVLSALKRAADIECGEPIDRVVMGHPVAFVGAAGNNFDRKQRLALERLDTAARIAGFTDVALMPEPAAALAGEELPDGYSVAVDFGGGTFDIAVIQVVDGIPEIASLQGASIGGTNLDATLFDLKVAEAIGLNDEIEETRMVRRFPAAVRRRMKTLGGARSLMNDSQLVFTLRRLEAAGLDVQAVRSILHGGHAFGFYNAIEQAKIDLSGADESEIYYVRRGALAVIEPVTRTEFDSAIQPLIRQIAAQIHLATEQAGVRTDDVAVVVRTGGSSSVPLFVDMLESSFPNSDIRQRPPFTSVAAGLGVVAIEEWGHG